MRQRRLWFTQQNHARDKNIEGAMNLLMLHDLRMTCLKEIGWKREEFHQKRCINYGEDDFHIAFVQTDNKFVVNGDGIDKTWQ